MLLILGYMLVFAASFIKPPAGPPSMIFYPGWVTNWVSVPDPYYGCVLIGDKWFNDVSGRAFTGREFVDRINTSKPWRVRVLVDRHLFSFGKAYSIFRRLRDEIHVRTTIFVELCWMETTYSP